MALPRPASEWKFDAERLQFDVERMREVPGIYFEDTPTGYHAHILGTGVGVWEVVRAWRLSGNQDDAVPWLKPEQLRAALDYAEKYPEEIDERIRLDDEVTPEWLAANYPELLAPGGAHRDAADGPLVPIRAQ